VSAATTAAATRENTDETNNVDPALVDVATVGLVVVAVVLELEPVPVLDGVLALELLLPLEALSPPVPGAELGIPVFATFFAAAW
jgi:hypothetical protein